jgi:hypothetical protein
MNLVLIDIVWNGHVPTYHKYFAQVLLELGHDVLSISPNPDDVLDWVKRNIPDQRHKIKCVLFEGATILDNNLRMTRLSKARAVIREILASFHLLTYAYDLMSLKNTMILWKKTNVIIESYLKQYNLPDTVIIFFPYIDYLFLHRWLTYGLLEYLFHFRWAALYLHPTHLRKNPNYKRLTFCPDSIFFSKNCVGVSLLDETVVEQMGKRIKKPAIWFPDITDNIFDGHISNLSKSILERAKGRKIVTLLGGISQKKNLVLLLKAAEICLEKQSPYFFLVAGTLQLDSWSEPDRHFILATIEKKPDNVFIYLESIPDGTEYNSLFLISDMIFAVYSSFYHSSNSLTKAALFERPVIVSEGHLMAERVAKYRTGLAISEEDISKCIETIDRLAHRIDFNGMPLKPKYKEYRELHSQNSLRAAFADLLSSIHFNPVDTV